MLEDLYRFKFELPGNMYKIPCIYTAKLDKSPQTERENSGGIKASRYIWHLDTYGI